MPQLHDIAAFDLHRAVLFAADGDAIFTVEVDNLVVIAVLANNFGVALGDGAMVDNNIAIFAAPDDHFLAIKREFLAGEVARDDHQLGGHRGDDLGFLVLRQGRRWLGDRGRFGRRLFALKREAIRPDADDIARGKFLALLDLDAILFDAIACVDILNENALVLADNTCVFARDVAFGQPNGIPFLATNCNFVSDDRNSARASLFIRDDQLVHARSL